MVKGKFGQTSKNLKLLQLQFSEILFLLFMFLLTTPVVKSDHILAGIYFIFLRESPRLNLEGFSIPTFDLREKIAKVAIV